MATIAKLDVFVRARTKLFDRAMKRSGKTVRSFSRTVSGAGMRALKFGAAMAGVASVGGMVLLVKNSMAAIDVIAKLSDRIGVATEDIVGLGHAASIMGSDNEAMNKALEIFVRRLGEVRMGSGEAKDGLDALGITADQLVNMKTADAFLLVADGISKIPTAADKAATAYKLFGRQGAALVNLLDLGAGGIRELIKEADRLGLTFDRIDAAQVEAANDAMTRVKAVGAGLVRTLTFQLAPSIEGIATALTRTGIDGKLAGEKIYAGFSLAAVSVGVLADAVNTLRIGWNLAAYGAQGLMSGPAKIGTAWNSMVAKMPGPIGEMGEKWRIYSQALADAADERSANLLKTIKSIEDKPSVAEGIRKWLAKVEAEAAKARAALAAGGGSGGGGGGSGGIGEVFEKAKAKIDRFNDSLVAQIAMFGKSRHALQLFNLEQAGLGLTGAGADRFANLLDDARHYIAKLDEMKRVEKHRQQIMGDAARIFDQTRTPMERYESQITKLNVLLDKGAITWDTYGRAVRAAKKDLGGGVGGGVSGPGSAMAIGRAVLDLRGLTSMGAKPELRELQKITGHLGAIRAQHGEGEGLN